MKAEEIFNTKAHYNKWLKELTKSEYELVIEMLNEAIESPLPKVNDWDEVKKRYLEDKGLQYDASLNSYFANWLIENYSAPVSPSDAIEFAEWIVKKGIKDSAAEGMWLIMHEGSNVDIKQRISSKDLYTLFKTEK